LFEDALQSSPSFQNALIEIVSSQTYNNTNTINACICFTNTIKTLDSLYNDVSSSLLHRVVPMFVTDTSFIQHTQKLYNDELGDVGFLNFLEQADLIYYFDKKISIAIIEQLRTLDTLNIENQNQLFSEITRLLIKHLESSDLTNTHIRLDDITTLQKQFDKYYSDYVKTILPLASDFINLNQFNIDKLQEIYNNGTTIENQKIGKQFANACVDKTIGLIIKNQNLTGSDSISLEDIIGRFSKSISGLEENEFAFALDKFKHKLINNPAFSITMENETRLLPDTSLIVYTILLQELKKNHFELFGKEKLTQEQYHSLELEKQSKYDCSIKKAQILESIFNTVKQPIPTRFSRAKILSIRSNNVKEEKGQAPLKVC
jgi:hypothetical protein